MGSFDEMPVTVAFLHYLLVYFTPAHERKLVLSLHATAKRDMARPLAWVVAGYARLEGDRHWRGNLDMQSYTHRAYPHTHYHADKTLTILVQWCVTARVQPLARKHGFCERSQGKHLPHRTVAGRQQSGRCRRHCTCRRPAGNGFNVQEVCVQGVCSVSPQMLLHRVV